LIVPGHSKPTLPGHTLGVPGQVRQVTGHPGHHHPGLNHHTPAQHINHTGAFKPEVTIWKEL